MFSRVNFQQPRHDPYEARRQEQKEFRRREKMERRARRAERARERRRGDERGDMRRDRNVLARVSSAQVEDQRYNGFKLPQTSGRGSDVKGDRASRKAFPGLGAFRNAAWVPAPTQVAPCPDRSRDRRPRVVQDWVDMLWPRGSKTMPNARAQPVATRSRKDLRAVEMGVNTGGYYSTGQGRGEAARPVGVKRPSAKKWSDRAKASRRR